MPTSCRSRAPPALHRRSEIHTAGLWSLLLHRGRAVDLPFFRCSGCPAQARRAGSRWLFTVPLAVAGCRRCRHGCRQRYELTFRSRAESTRTITRHCASPRSFRWVGPFGPKPARAMRTTTTLTMSDLPRTVRGRPLVSAAVVTHPPREHSGGWPTNHSPGIGLAMCDLVRRLVERRARSSSRQAPQ